MAKDDAVTELARSLGLLWRRLRTAAGDDEPSLGHMSALARIAKLGPITTADLARAEAMKPQSMGTIVAALEELGLVARQPHPTDGRQLLLAVTPKGVAARKTRRDAKRTWLAQAMSQLDKHEQATLLAASDIIRKLVEL